MKIGELNQHCGNCGLIEFCGNPYGFCICTQERFEDIEEEIYKSIADNAVTNPYKACCDCQINGDGDCDKCEKEDDARDWYCEQVADYVYDNLKGGD